MAESKRSFILYADLIHTVKKMPKEKAGELLCVILEYVNDLDPIVEDLLVDLVFEPIKQQLKRDLDRWESEKEIKSQNGIIGNLKRWNLDLYQQYLNKSITLEKAIEIANSRKPSLPDSEGSQDVAKIAVNVNVTDTVNVIKKIIPTPKGEEIDPDKFIEVFNSFASRNFRVTTKVESALKARAKNGYTKKEIFIAMKNAHNDKFHMENAYKDLTPEFILRQDKLEKYINKQQPTIPFSQNGTHVPMTNKIDHSNRD